MSHSIKVLLIMSIFMFISVYGSQQSETEMTVVSVNPGDGNPIFTQEFIKDLEELDQQSRENKIIAKLSVASTSIPILVCLAGGSSNLEWFSICCYSTVLLQQGASYLINRAKRAEIKKRLSENAKDSEKYKIMARYKDFNPVLAEVLEQFEKKHNGTRETII